MSRRRRRVVVTGAGIVAPNGIGLDAFVAALREGRSGVSAQPVMEEFGFGCTVAGVPDPARIAAISEREFPPDLLRAMNASHRFAAIAALEAWADAGRPRPSLDDGDDDAPVHWETGAVIGTGIGGLDTTGEKLIPLTDAGRVRRLGSTVVEQIMGSGVSARVSGLLALGNQVTSNSSACSTGAEAIVHGFRRIQEGRAQAMLCGGSEADSPYIWAGFDSMRVLCRDFNDEPEAASRPLSASACGFVPGSGAGILHLESLESARARGAPIYAEILGADVNCGGHRNGGSMTAPNPEGVRRCIRAAVAEAGIQAAEIDAINGHLTGTGADPGEVANWSAALELGPGALPMIHSTKSLIGHGLGAAGALESVACMLMLRDSFLHASRNCEDVHPEIEPYRASIPHDALEAPGLSTIAKAGFGFGDVNACLIFRRWGNEAGEAEIRTTNTMTPNR